jgi:hypothetical protein
MIKADQTGGEVMRMRLKLLSMCLVFSASVSAESIRCGRALVKVGDSSNQLLKKCGEPDSKFSGKTTIRDHGRESSVSVSNWVYRQSGKKDKTVSVYAGAVLNIDSD